MPGPIEFLRQSGRTRISRSRALNSDNSRNSTPEMNTMARPACHENPIVSTTVNAKKKFSPMPGASANGYRATRPMSRHAAAEDRHVASSTEPPGMPATWSTAGCTNTM